jgi:NAD(P)-dependent dehydrogenase (short-subunit alcohol dehydrogenase family)
MWQEFINLGMAEDVQGAKEVVTAMHPLGLGRPEDVAAGCLYLASDASRWVTGTELIMDGGLQIS